MNANNNIAKQSTSTLAVSLRDAKACESTLNAKNNIGIYIHWPYCTHICPYCDFNIYRARGRDTDGLFNAIILELKNWAKTTGAQKLTSLYFGGGTPSLMDAAQIAQIIELCDNLWGFEENPEIVLEANPNEFEINKFKDFNKAGIERLSLGVQSFLDNGLKDLGRFHNASDAINATKKAREIFPRLSIDLIYARQNQSLKDWEFEIETAISLGIDHVSPYQLTIEPNTAFERKHKRGAIKIPDNDLAADFYDLTQNMLNSKGFIAYEISNHAKNNAAKSRHNELYWQSQNWLGIGPGAHGRLTQNGQRRALLNLLRPDEYIKAINEKGFALCEDEILSLDEITQEYYLMGLRLLNGIKMPKDLPLDENNIKELMALGFIEISGENILLKPSARTISNRIIAELLA